MLTALALAAAFASAALLVYAAARGARLLVLRHPEARLELETGQDESFALLRAWRLAIRVAMGEMSRRAPRGTRRRIDLALRQADEAETSAELFVGRAAVEGLALAVGTALLLLVLYGGVVKCLVAGALLGTLHAALLRPQRLRSQAAQRMNEIARRLPYAVELATLVLGAGGTPRQALETLARHDDPLGQEFARALREMNAGASQSAALQAMADRLQHDDLSSLVVAVNQGEATGAPMVRSLESQAEVFRFRRLQRAERLAVEAPVKMMFPTVLILVSVMILILGPLFVQILQQDIF